ncbi:hypothetical protein V8F33_007239 [Rhypophila sp. PSN 637]
MTSATLLVSWKLRLISALRTGSRGIGTTYPVDGRPLLVLVPMPLPRASRRRGLLVYGRPAFTSLHSKASSRTRVSCSSWTRSAGREGAVIAVRNFLGLAAEVGRGGTLPVSCPGSINSVNKKRHLVSGRQASYMARNKMAFTPATGNWSVMPLEKVGYGLYEERNQKQRRPYDNKQQGQEETEETTQKGCFISVVEGPITRSFSATTA